METSQKVFVAIGTVAVVGLAVVGGRVLLAGGTATQASGAQSPMVSQNSSLSQASQPAATSSTAQYKDGQYTATQVYSVPHGVSNSIAVILTVADGKISAIQTSNQYSDRESGMYVNSFESKVQTDAGGQSLASYGPSRIGGASLTTEAFAQAINAIRSQAAA